jgi:hypothetical protein
MIGPRLRRLEVSQQNQLLVKPSTHNDDNQNEFVY